MEDQVLRTLSQSGLRMTLIRRNLVSLLAAAPSPLSVGDVLNKIKANKTTIYREIEILLKFGQLTKVDFADGKNRYELSGLAHHHHLICLKCRRVQDILLKENFRQEEYQIKNSKNFRVLKHSLEFFGYCQNCV